MTIEWTTIHDVEFPEETMERICDRMREKYDEDLALKLINSEVAGFEDYDYYAWDHDQTLQVLNEVKRRIEGVQLEMDLGI